MDADTIQGLTLLIFGGIAAIIVGIIMKYQQKQLLRNCTMATKAIVVGLSENVSSNDSGASMLYAPIFQYYVGDEAITGVAPVYTNHPSVQVGQEVTLYYDPQNSSTFVVSEDTSSSNFPYMVMGIGVLFVVVGALIMMFA